jgi:hypothetical protein
LDRYRNWLKRRLRRWIRRRDDRWRRLPDGRWNRLDHARPRRQHAGTLDLVHRLLILAGPAAFDRLMDRLATRYPWYGWEHNAGYATLDHRRGIEEHGITAFHRRSFARVRAVELGVQMELDFAVPESLETVEEFEEIEIALATA